MSRDANAQQFDDDGCAVDSGGDSCRRTARVNQIRLERAAEEARSGAGARPPSAPTQPEGPGALDRAVNAVGEAWDYVRDSLFPGDALVDLSIGMGGRNLKALGAKPAMTPPQILEASREAGGEVAIVGAMVLPAVPKVLMGKQGKHILGHNNFKAGRSVLTADPERLAVKAGTGAQVGDLAVGTPGSKERVDFGEIIGDYFDMSGNASPTSVGIVHYAKDGIHIVPAAP